ncbi:MAG: hypothetical protein R2705_15605 [Ilumatobacteraceae bacterium]
MRTSTQGRRRIRRPFTAVLGALALLASAGCGSEPQEVVATSTTTEFDSIIAANDGVLTLAEWNSENEDRAAVGSGFYAAQELMDAMCVAISRSPSQHEAMSGIVAYSQGYDIEPQQAEALVRLAATHVCEKVWTSLPA